KLLAEQLEKELIACGSRAAGESRIVGVADQIPQFAHSLLTRSPVHRLGVEHQPVHVENQRAGSHVVRIAETSAVGGRRRSRAPPARRPNSPRMVSSTGSIACARFARMIRPQSRSNFFQPAAYARWRSPAIAES